MPKTFKRVSNSFNYLKLFFMKKMKMFFVAAGLLLVTAGVFAGKAKFADSGLWGYNSTGGYKLLLPATSFPDDLTTSPTSTQASIIGASGTYALYTNTGTNAYSGIYATNF
jgi:hypothetical protein